MKHHGMAFIDGTYDATHHAPRGYRFTICEQLIPTRQLLAPEPVTCDTCQVGYMAGVATLSVIGHAILTRKGKGI